MSVVSMVMDADKIMNTDGAAICREANKEQKVIMSANLSKNEITQILSCLRSISIIKVS